MTYSDRRDEPHWVYRCYDDANRLLYVGCTMNLKRRRSEHEGTAWFQFMARSVIRGPFDYETARQVEREQIETLHPHFNETNAEISERQRSRYDRKRRHTAFFAAHPDASSDDYWAAIGQEQFNHAMSELDRPLDSYLATRSAAA